MAGALPPALQARLLLSALLDHYIQAANAAATEKPPAQRAIDSIRDAVIGHLASTPFSFRKAGSSSLRRELIIPFGSSGYVALYEIEPEKERVVVLAVRHQVEDDYH